MKFLTKLNKSTGKFPTLVRKVHSFMDPQMTKHRVLHGMKIILLLVIFLAGCGNPVNIKHPYVLSEADAAHVAKVYFIRPQPYKFKGIADNTLSVDFKEQKLLDIDEGQYTLVKLKPSSGSVTTHSRTQFTAKDAPINVSRSRDYHFVAGNTYFIYLKRVNEEFRGIFYDPAPINLPEALQLAESLRARGLAKQEPIENVSIAKDAPAPSPLQPAYPENLYPGKPYLIKGNPKYQAPKPPEGKNEMTFDEPVQQNDKPDSK